MAQTGPFEFLRLLHPEAPRFRVHGIYRERGKLPDPLPDWWYLVKERNGSRPASMHNAFVSTPEKLAEFIEQCESVGCNVYYSVNRGSVRVPVKLRADQITHVDYLHMDYDLRSYPNDCSDPADHCRKIMLTALDGLKMQLPPPTFVVFSGGGLNLLWRLAETLANQDPNYVAGYNKALAETIHGADPVHDVSRILRLPGTMNIPGTEKLARGRVPVSAELWEYNPDAVLDIARCAHAPVATKPEREYPELKDLPTPTSLLDVIPPDQHGTHRVDRLLLLAEHGYVVYSPKKGGDVVHVDEYGEKYVAVPDKSRWDFDFACEALRCKVKPEDIAGFLLNAGQGVGEHCRNQADPLRAAARCIGNAKAYVR